MDPDLRPQAPTPLPTNQDFQPNLPPQHNPISDLNKKQRKSRKKLWLFIAIPVVLVLALVAAFWFYYSAPNRVLGDVLKNTYDSETIGYDGTVTFRGTEADSPFEVTSQINGEGGNHTLSLNTSNKISVGVVDLNIDLGLIANQDSAYVKINNAIELGNLIQTFAGDNPEIDALLPLFEELESTWISFDGETTQQLGMESCDANKIEDWLESEKQTFYDLFKEHQFVTAKRGNDISLTEQHYSLAFNVQAAQEFFDHIEELESYKQMQQECNIDVSFDGSKAFDLSADIWVNPWTHELKRIAVKAVDPSYEMTMDLRVELNKQVNIQAPTDAKTLDDILGQYMQQQMEQQQQLELNSQLQ